jgi:hypothetical protein
MAHRAFAPQSAAEKAAPHQLYTNPADAPNGLQCAFATADEARENRRYWHNTEERAFVDRPEDSLFVFPAAVKLEGLLAHALPGEAQWLVPADGPHAVPKGDAPPGSVPLLEAQGRYLKAARKFPLFAAARKILKSGTDSEKTALRRNSLRYMMEVVGTGVYVRIEDGQVRQFIPFTDWEPANDWGADLAEGRMHEPLEDFLRRVARASRKPLSDVVQDPAKWTVSASVIGMEDWAGSTVNSKIPELRYLIDATLSRFAIGDAEFIFNRRDAPAVHCEGASPHFHLFDNDMASGDLPRGLRQIFSREGAAMLPVLSQSSIPGHFADLMIPTQDDVLLATGKSFINKAAAPMLRPERDPACVTEWRRKAATAVFRGAGTGAGTDAARNQRYALALVSSRAARNPAYNDRNAVDGVPFLDAGITSFNARPKKTLNAPLSIADPRRLGIATVPPLDACAQSKFKYSLYVDGHAFAFRLLRVMLTGSVVLYVQSHYDFAGWYGSLLVPWEHYVPVAADLRDVFARIEWCKTHDAEAKKIAANALALAQRISTEEYICGYFAVALNAISHRN